MLEFLNLPNDIINTIKEFDFRPNIIVLDFRKKEIYDKIGPANLVYNWRKIGNTGDIIIKISRYNKFVVSHIKVNDNLYKLPYDLFIKLYYDKIMKKTKTQVIIGEDCSNLYDKFKEWSLKTFIKFLKNNDKHYDMLSI